MTWIWKCICFEATCYFFHMQQNDMISGTIEWVVGKWHWEFRIDVILFFQITRSFTPLYFQQILGLLICILSILLFKTKKGNTYNYLIFHFRCNTTFEQQMLGLLYVLFLVTMVVVLSFKAKGVRENYREAMYIGLTMGFTVCIFLVWILGGFIAPPEYQVLNGKKSFELWCMYLKGW